MDRKNTVFKLIRIIGDITFVNLSFVIAFYLRFFNLPMTNVSAYLEQIPYISIFTVLLFHLYSLYSNQLKKDYADIFYTFIPSSLIIIFFSVTLSYFFQTYEFPRSVFLLVLPIMITLMIGWRYLTLKIEKSFSDPDRIVIIGQGDETVKIVKNIKAGTNGGYDITDVFFENNPVEEINNLDINDEFNVRTGFINLYESLRKIDPDLVFISGNLDENIKKDLFYHSLEEEWEANLVPDFYEIMLSGSELEQVGELPVFEMKRLNGNPNRILKRIFDIFISLVGLIVSLPFTIPAAIAIKLESNGPLFFRQQRISKNGDLFDVLKFRTMVNNAEKKTGPVLATKNDSRVTKIGNILRKTRIDEIPQLINVLKGDMSLIGPRPERPHFVKQFEDKIQDYKYRHRIKSGVTGLAQVFGYYSTDPEDKLRLDLLYANKASIVFDLKIVLHTIKVMFMGHKAS